MQSEKIIQPVNIPPIPPVKRARLSWWQTIPHTLRIYYMLRMQRMKLAMLEWLGVDQLIRNEVNARKANDDTAIGLLQRQGAQINRIAQSMPPLISARKRLEFYESPSQYLNHAKRRWDKANPRLTLEKTDVDTNRAQANGQAHDHGSSIGAGGEVPESPRPDAASEDGEAVVRRADDDRPLEGRGEVQVDAATRHEVIAEMMDSDEAAAGNSSILLKCDHCGNISHQPANLAVQCSNCGVGHYRLLMRATRHAPLVCSNGNDHAPGGPQMFASPPYKDGDGCPVCGIGRLTL